MAQVATLSEVTGSVTVRAAKAKQYERATVGLSLERGARIRTGDDGQATLQYPDGTTVRVRKKSQVIVRLAKAADDQPSGVVLFFGRVWAQVIKRVGGQARFEVESANAVAGVRGTQLEVGVADDGATRVLVTEGEVLVEGDTRGKTPIRAGYEVESDGRGRLAKRRETGEEPRWDGWFAARARKLEATGRDVALDLRDRLNRRRKKLERLVGQQRDLRAEIERLETEQSEASSALKQARSDGSRRLKNRLQRRVRRIEKRLEDRLVRLERVTERLVDMRRRLDAGLGIFQRWAGFGGEMAAVAREFADLYEEGTDLSPEGMEDMMKEMKQGPTLDPRTPKDGKNAADELF